MNHNIDHQNKRFKRKRKKRNRKGYQIQKDNLQR